MHNALVLVVNVVQRDAKLFAVFGKRLHLDARHFT
ncbi:Uncharacterised protein [Vibrio cholerae]|uniref:Uncharacterized protein n=1 Tax=Vibrio cholerae TaxID=666 RepID=A0A655YZF3_VIBCL|nr:Uncharacterised protein [Vibrio cholerae]CSA83765.1 Uncharacterised protein [Vibrio cholerae]CSB25339.1 Uncharacterised protein [Vibrio cholerae]CSB25472.1 Uncharacterised protein [Vibrio cholerae]CSB56050.1 Uncharacterised protein [Vibrio cholerae]